GFGAVPAQQCHRAGKPRSPHIFLPSRRPRFCRRETARCDPYACVPMMPVVMPAPANFASYMMPQKAPGVFGWTSTMLLPVFQPISLPSAETTIWARLKACRAFLRPSPSDVTLRLVNVCGLPGLNVSTQLDAENSEDDCCVQAAELEGSAEVNSWVL